MASKQKLLLLDGNSLANRAFYALRLFSTSDGVFTNAVYGFLTMLYKLIEEEKPDYLAVAFDKGGVTFRHAEFAEYKGTRKGAPDEFKPQLELLRQVLTTLNVPWYRVENFEADDLLGTLSKQASAKGIDTLVVTGDRDALQLIDDHITVVMTKKGISETVRYSPEVLKEEYGLSPQQIIDLKALMGDASDNIPGVPGVGEKTAVKLLTDFGTVDGVYEHLGEIKGALKEKLASNRDSAELSRRLATISLEAPVAFSPEEFKLKDPNFAEAIALFKRLEFKSLLPKVTPKEGAPEAAEVAEVVNQAAVTAVTPVEVRSAAELLERTAKANTVAILAFCSSPTSDPGRPIPVSAAVAAGSDVLWLSSEALSEAGLGALLSRSGLTVIGQDLKPVYNWAYGRGITPVAPEFDATLAMYLLDPGRTNYLLEDMARHFGLGELPSGDLPAAWATRASVLPQLREKMLAALDEQELMHLYREIELPLMPVLAEMESIGVGI
ncbi:MAG TPA: 5'-3' exonuclease H3TH domain-containing protein, partial [Symbiobacteriaceae bacterium]|nr:5'-3' exonuclease H3TH domain-containing protein [Symbiobacteriaceae bacterium]